MSQPLGLRARKKAATRSTIARAALDLFAARGFDEVTLAEVAEAADVGQRTLFRYYADKEELLFGDDAAVQAHLEAALAARPADEAPAAAAREALVALAPLWQSDREHGRIRRAVIDAAPALVARQRAKHAAYEHVLHAGLIARGQDAVQARLLARVAVTCVDEGTTRWFADAEADRPGLAARVRATFTDLAQQLEPVDRSV